ncbi:hypothetical protein E8E11_002489 [Didymella keratinophila]|nr:hypothetical protein E8E11_002489 [Didymella keratinophila]
MHYGYYGFDGNGFNGFHGCEHSTYNDSKYATGVLEFINVEIPPRDGTTRNGLDYDDGMVATFPVTTQHDLSDTDRYSETFTASKGATIEGIPL